MTISHHYAAGEKVLPLLPLRDIIIFPHMVVPLFVGREKSIRALEEAMNHEKDILLVAQVNAKTNDPKPEDIFKVGTVGTIIQLLRLPDGTVKVQKKENAVLPSKSIKRAISFSWFPLRTSTKT